jgi:hypothetical protein
MILHIESNLLLENEMFEMQEDKNYCKDILNSFTIFYKETPDGILIEEQKIQLDYKNMNELFYYVLFKEEIIVDNSCLCEEFRFRIKGTK